ncbi:MAG TPA: site-specific integrase [Noviherbaspirillum sp.]|uniref:site-specific integrase n=1 Tax=Noviherbaspirillum sp. TaxID=1926288 RepID=UPI002B48E441|nr:site-specific integrase [Noviherbaspirillum sp.]HJV86779.1 site-specific integrase [Noviherbaspirillum sp.]
MQLPSYLVRNRLGIYYLRVVIPRAWRLSYPVLPREIRRSLHTRNPRLAKTAARRFAAAYDLFLQSKTMETAMRYDNEASQWLIGKAADGRLQVTRQPGDDPNDLSVIIHAMMENGRVPLEVLENPFQRATFVPSAREIRETRTLLRQQGNDGRGEWLSDAILRYKQDMELEERWASASTWPGAYEPALRHFREIIAPDETTAEKRTVVINGKTARIFDIPVADIDATHIRQFKSVMSVWPKGFGQGTRGTAKGVLTAKDALAMTHLPRQSAQNAIKKCEVVKAFLRWAYIDGCIPEGDRFAGILPSKQRKKNGEGKHGYLRFTDAELHILFESVDYRDNLFKTAAQYWIPLIGLYTGARINEIAQMDVADIVVSEEGIRCFHITDTEDEDEHDGELYSPEVSREDFRKSVKTDAARRLVPIHPKLIEIGLDLYLEYVKSLGHKRLFPELTYEPKSGYGRIPSRTFREYTKRYGVYRERKKVFHSFRSTLNGILQKKGMTLEHRSRLIGHATKSVNDQHYGGETPLQQIAEQLARVDYGIDHPKYWVPKDLPTLG